MSLTVVDHPMIKHKLGLMRQHDISTKDFRDSGIRSRPAPDL